MRGRVVFPQPEIPARTTRTCWMSRPPIPRAPLRVRCCCSWPAKLSPARTEFLISPVRCRTWRCALPRATEWSACGWPTRWRLPTRGPAAPGMSRRRSPGSARTSICSGATATRSSPSATPPAHPMWRAILRIRNFSKAVPMSPASCWCRGFIVWARTRVLRKRPILATDASKYEERSAFPGIVHIETPILLAWSVIDSPEIIAQGEKLKEFLCNVPAHCPHIKVLDSREGLHSVFSFDIASDSLAGATIELVREIEARGPALRFRLPAGAGRCAPLSRRCASCRLPPSASIPRQTELPHQGEQHDVPRRRAMRWRARLRW